MKKLLSTLAFVAVGLSLFGQSYTEGADLSNTAPGDTFVFMNTFIEIEGTMTTPGDGSEYFVIDLPSGCQISSVAYKISDQQNLGITGYFQFGVNNQVSYSGSSSGNFPSAGQFPTVPFPKAGPALIQCQAQANIASQTAWKMAFVGSCSPCSNPSLPSLTASPTSMCSAGSPVTLSIVGTLGDAKTWMIYSGSCGGTFVGDTSGASFTVMPTTTTTYYVRGEGGCVTPGNCSSITVVVGDSTAPVIVCPPDQVDYLEGSCNFTIPSYVSLATVTDNCDTSPTVSQMPMQGSLVIGDTTITMTGADSSGNSTQCTFKLTILDTLSPIDTSLTKSGNVLTANHLSASYQWVDCANNYSQLAGETAATCQFCKTNSGSYALVVSEQGCIDTSSCYTITTVGIADEGLTNIRIYPNPTDHAFFIDVPAEFLGAEARLIDLNGKVQGSIQLVKPKEMIPVENLTEGMYFLRIGAYAKKLLIR